MVFSTLEDVLFTADVTLDCPAQDIKSIQLYNPVGGNEPNIFQRFFTLLPCINQ